MICRSIVAVTAAAILMISAVVMLAGCSKEVESLVGTWTSAEQGETLDFRADGYLFFTKANGEVVTLKWQADDQHLAIGVEGGGNESFAYSIDDGVLTLTFPGEEPATYQRLDLMGG